MKIGVALIGTGLMGRMHSHAFRAAGARLVAVCGRDGEALRREFGWASTAHWEDAVARPDVQLVVVATRNADHRAPALAALAAGRAVLCEKPLAGTLADARAMREAAAGVAACAFNYRFVPALELARAMIARGELGDVLHVRSRFLLRTALEDSEAWRRSHPGGGVVGDLASHHVDLVRSLAGEPVRALARTRTLRRGDTEDAAVALLELASGASAVAEASRMAGGHRLTSELEVDGSAGSLAFTLHAPDALVWRRGDERRVLAAPGGPWPAGHPSGWEASFVHQAADLLRCVAEDRPPRVSFEDGYRCAAVCDAILRSNGAPVPVTP